MCERETDYIIERREQTLEIKNSGGYFTYIALVMLHCITRALVKVCCYMAYSMRMQKSFLKWIIYLRDLN